MISILYVNDIFKTKQKNLHSQKRAAQKNEGLPSNFYINEGQLSVYFLLFFLDSITKSRDCNITVY